MFVKLRTCLYLSGLCYASLSWLFLEIIVSFLPHQLAACSTESFSLLSWSFQESSILKNKGTLHFLCKEPVAKPLAGTRSLLGRTAWDKLWHNPVCIPEAQPGPGWPSCLQTERSHHLLLLSLLLNGKMNLTPPAGACVSRSSLSMGHREESLSVFSVPHTPGWAGTGQGGMRRALCGSSELTPSPGNRWQCGNGPAVPHWPKPSSLPGISEHQSFLGLSSHGAHSGSFLYPPLTDPLV